MAGVTSLRGRKINRLHGDIMPTAVLMIGEIAGMTFSTKMGQNIQGRTGCRAGKHPASDAAKMTEYARARMDASNNLAFLSFFTGTCRPVTGLARGYPVKGAITLYM